MAVSNPIEASDCGHEGPEFQRFLKALPADVLASLNARQLDAMASALAPQRGPHWIDLRASMPFPGRRIYVALLIGRERRNRTRLAAEGQLGLGPTLLVAGTFIALVVASIAAAVLVVSLVRSSTGLDLIPMPSLMTPAMETGTRLDIRG